MKDTAQKQVKDTAQKQVEDTAQKQVEDTTLKQMKDTARKQVKETTLKQVKETTLKQVKETTLKADKKTTRKLSVVQKDIIECLRKNPGIGRKQMASIITSVSEDGIKYNLKVLAERGFIKRIGGARGGYWKVILP